MADIGENRNVFISWSGDRSKAVAEALWVWLPQVIPAVLPWISTHDLEKGTQWQAEITGQLQTSNIGVFCLTPENLTAPWILFEAGSLWKGLGANRVFTIYLESNTRRFYRRWPPSTTRKLTKLDTLRLLHDINRAVGGTSPEEHLKILFEEYWPKLEKAFQAVPPPESEPGPQRSAESMLSEILEAVRQRTEPNLSDFESRVIDRLSRIEQAVHPTARGDRSELVRNPRTLPHPAFVSSGGEILVAEITDAGDRSKGGIALSITGAMDAAEVERVNSAPYYSQVEFEGRNYRIVNVSSDGRFTAVLIPGSYAK